MPLAQKYHAVRRLRSLPSGQLLFLGLLEREIARVCGNRAVMRYVERHLSEEHVVRLVTITSRMEYPEVRQLEILQSNF